MPSYINVLNSIKINYVTFVFKFDSKMIAKPQQDEYGEYYQGYIDKSEDPYTELKLQLDQLAVWIKEWNKPLDYRYAPEKWSVSQLILHLIDSETVFLYRLLRLSRHDATPMNGFDQDLFMEHTLPQKYTKEKLIQLWKACRTHTLAMIQTLDESALDFKGEASGYPLTARACLFILSGHVRHHMDILNERY